MTNRTAVVVGATGLVGKELVEMLIHNEHYEKVTVLVRRTLNIKAEKLTELIIDFDQLDKSKHLFVVDDVFCCLGTTIKKAKSKKAFKKVDLQYPYTVAKLAKEAGVEKFLIISAMGANSTSSFFYNKVKGELEEQLKSLGLNSLHIFRPSLLLGEREEFRLGERLGAVFAKGMNMLLIGPLRTYRAISGEQVALAMMKVALKSNQRGVYTYKSSEIEALK